MSNRYKAPRSNPAKRRSRPLVRRMLLGAAALAMLGVALVIAHIGDPRPAPWVRGNGLRVSGAGRNDASHVLDPASFEASRVRDAYAIARAIPATLNQLYCWCHCEENLGMRSLLECYESAHAAGCVLCLGEAELAWKLTRQGTTNPAEIQAAIDAWVGPT